VTVAEWISARSSRAPAELSRQVLQSLGVDAQLDSSETGRACIEAARRSLSALVTERRFDRDSALDLLAVDALTTWAFEHAAASGDVSAMIAAADQGITAFGQIVPG
jgi:hypothetical protein